VSLGPLRKSSLYLQFCANYSNRASLHSTTPTLMATLMGISCNISSLVENE